MTGVIMKWDWYLIGVWTVCLAFCLGCWAAFLYAIVGIG